MHTLTSAQQVAVSSSLPLSRSSSSSLLRTSLISSRAAWNFFSIPICGESKLKAKPSWSAAVTTSVPAILVLHTGLRIRNAFFVTNCRNRLINNVKDDGYDRLERSIGIRSFASRKDRREMERGDSAKLDPDIAALRNGFLKKFPTSDVSEFCYDWDSDDDDDGVQVKSFKSGNYGRARLSSSSNSASDRYNRTAGNKADSSPGRGSAAMDSHDEFAHQRRKSEDNTGISERTRRKTLGGDRQGPKGRKLASESLEGVEDRSFRTPAQPRVDAATSSNILERDRSTGNRGNGKAGKSNDVGGHVRRGREPYGGGEWSKDTPVFDDEEEKKKKKPVIEAVKFMSAMSKDPHVAILGGGMSGLVCALTLEGHGIQSTVFDTGKHGLGGRMGTRYVEEYDGERLVFDHGAQFFTVRDERFQKLVDHWISEGMVREWQGNVGTLRAGGHYTELSHATRYIGTNGMRSLADHMLSKSRRINVKRPCWISSMEAVNGLWKLTENRNPQGDFDAVVIAHNGKCANRLLSTAHVPLIARQMKRLELSSIWALLAAFKEPLHQTGGGHLDGAFVEGVDSLSWMGNNSSKLVLLGDKAPECWTFFSTAAYGQKHKVPQESIPVAKAQRVKKDMLHGVEAALGLAEDSLPTPVYTRLQLWGAALPKNTPTVPCIFDSNGRVGICGDWLLGSSLEAAALSGMALADHIAQYRDHADENGDFSIGLQQSFDALMGHDIGEFPGAEELPTQSQQELFAVA